CEVRKRNDTTPQACRLHVQGGQNAGCCRPASGSKAERLSFPLCLRKRTNADISACPLCANSDRTQRSKKRRYSVIWSARASSVGGTSRGIRGTGVTEYLAGIARITPA